MNLSTLLGCKVVSTVGWPFGHVHDVRVERSASGAEVVSLIVGRPGLEERLFGRGDTSQHPHRIGHGIEVPWSAVIKIDKKTITIEERRQ